MKKRTKRIVFYIITTTFIFTIIVLTIFTFFKSKTSSQNKPLLDSNNPNYYTSNLPFKMPEITLTKFQSHDFNIKDYGAVSDGITKNTTAFAKAISACNSSGGGGVIVPTGTWLTGPIELKSNVNLYLETGSLITFSENHADFPIIKEPTSTAYTVASPIYGFNLTNIAITGNGVFNGSGDTCRPVKKSKTTESQWKALLTSGGLVSSDGSTWWPSKQALNGEEYLRQHSKDLTIANYENLKDYMRPYMLNLVNCKTILIDGPTFENSPNLTLYISKAQDLVIKDTKVFNEWNAQNGDGVDISACKNVVMYNCTINAGDDAIALKSSKSSNSSEDVAMENIVIANCIVNHGHGGFVIGSNTDGGIKNVFVHNCTYIGTDAGVKFKSNAGSGGLVENVYIDEINMKDIQTNAIAFDSAYSDSGSIQPTDSKTNTSKLPQFQDIHISNVNCKNSQTAISIKGLSAMPVKNIELNNIVIYSNSGFSAINTTGIKMNNIKILSKRGSTFSLENSDNYELNNLLCAENTNIFLQLEGSKTKNIKLTNTNTTNAKQAIKFGHDVKNDAIVSK